MIIKVCGLTEGGNIRGVAALPIEMTGFIFYPRSPRFVRSIPSYLPDIQERVGVFVDASEREILERAGEFGLTFLQLHGSESPELCKSLRSRGYGVIKAFGIRGAEDFARAADYRGCCDLLLFDAKCDCFGGSGRGFDHDLLGAYEGDTPFLLSGGIRPEHASELLKIEHPRLAGFDLNSGFETAPGVKDPSLIADFLCRLGKTERDMKAVPGVSPR